jgi:hypothetical protein
MRMLLRVLIIPQNDCKKIKKKIRKFFYPSVLQGKKSELHQNEQEEGEERPDLDGFALGVASAVKK